MIFKLSSSKYNIYIIHSSARQIYYIVAYDKIDDGRKMKKGKRKIENSSNQRVACNCFDLDILDKLCLVN